MLAERGATLIDADVLAREAVRPDTQALKDIVKRWGNDVLQQDGSLDRAALRQIVFADQNELDALNRALASDEWNELLEKLNAFVTDYKQKIVFKKN